MIKNIQQPVLILWGEQDLLIPVRHAYRFHNDLPNDTLVVLKNAGHVPMEESPVESIAPLREFLKKKRRYGLALLAGSTTIRFG